MSQFEYIFVLISIVTGLALTRLLSGLTQSFTTPGRKAELEHVLFTLAIIVVILAVWWSSFRWEDREVWAVWDYSLLCVYMSMFFAMAAILHPYNSGGAPRFENIRTPLYTVFILYQFVEWLVIFVRDGEVSASYLFLIFHLDFLAAIGIFLRSKRFDQLFAAWLLITSLGWQYLYRVYG